ncbi:RNA-binding S4 domain-containing protein [Chitinimonas lacunae]|uniref:RNA-binding S4 domain-containing protein n=1 Tax=Chitinimonas lacunae TaxID=1963018 RepID=A0ABV8MQ18_9NEIS
MANYRFHLTSEYIELDNLLKHLGLAPSGGAAKAMVADGLVKVDGELETRKTRKLRAGQVVSLGDDTVTVLPPT